MYSPTKQNIEVRMGINKNNTKSYKKIIYGTRILYTKYIDKYINK